MCSTTGDHNVVSVKFTDKSFFFHFLGIYKNTFVSYHIFKCHSESVPTLPNMFSNCILNVLQNIVLTEMKKIQ